MGLATIISACTHLILRWAQNFLVDRKIFRQLIQERATTATASMLSSIRRSTKNVLGLLLMNGVVYTGWASHCDDRPYTGWIIGFDASTLAQTSVLNVTPNGNEGAIWMAGAGLAADNSGNIFFLDANGEFDTTLNASGFPSSGDYGNAFMKLSTSSGLAVADYFEMDNQSQENSTDTDFGSGGTVVLPDLSDGAGHTLHLAVGAGKDSNLYVVNRDAMGKFTSSNSGVYQQLSGALPGGVWAMPAYFNNTIYYGSVGSPILAFTITNAKLSTAATAHTANSFGYPGATPSISANGTSNGIVWAFREYRDCRVARLRRRQSE